MTAVEGSWTQAPTSFTYQWLRCDSSGNNCGAIGGAVGQSYVVAAQDVNGSLRVRVAARNERGSDAATSAQTAPVGTGTGGSAIPIASLALPDRLVVTGVKFTPSVLGSRGPFVARFLVADTRGRPIAGALVYVLGLPYAWLNSSAEVTTGNDGWATLTLSPTSALPRNGALVMFVRARKPGDSLLAGVSTRRLVQVKVRF